MTVRQPWSKFLFVVKTRVWKYDAIFEMSRDDIPNMNAHALLCTVDKPFHAVSGNKIFTSFQLTRAGSDRKVPTPLSINISINYGIT